MRHIAFIINSAFKNKFGNLFFLRFIYQNFTKKVFIGYKDFKNSVWGEKWFLLNIKEILKLLKQRNNIKSKSTNIFYVQQLAYGVASFVFFAVRKSSFLSLLVQRSNLKVYFVNNFFINLNFKIKTRMLNTCENVQLATIKKIYMLN